MSMESEKHLSCEGLIEIIDLAKDMNTTNRPRLDEIRSELIDRIKR